MVLYNMVEGIVAAEQFELLPIAKAFATLVFKDGADHEWLERKFAMYKDILDESWYVQEIKHEGLCQGAQRSLLDVLQARFPAIVSFVEQPIKDMNDLPTLRQLLVKVSIAQTAEDALQAFSNLQTVEKKDR